MGYKKLIQSGNVVETYEYKYDYIPRRIKSRTRAVRCKRTTVRNRRTDNLFRLKRGFVRLVRSNLTRDEDPVLFTLTMFETVSVGVAYGFFSRFVQVLRNRYGEIFRYIGVVEFQGDKDYKGRLKENRGAVHFHVLFWGLPDSVVLEEGSWIGDEYTRVKYAQWLVRKGYKVSQLRCDRTIQRCWKRGYVDVVPTDGSFKIAGYLGKYLFKAMSDERLLAKKAYVASRNVLRPVSLSFASAFEHLSRIVGDVPKIQTAHFNSLWLGPCLYTRYEILEK